MNKFHSIRSAIYNKVWGRPKSALGAYLRRKCDSIPANRRLTLITVLLSLFIITAFFVFGNACYRIGRGQALMERMEPEHRGSGTARFRQRRYAGYRSIKEVRL